jgi:hypothetical protein
MLGESHLSRGRSAGNSFSLYGCPMTGVHRERAVHPPWRMMKHRQRPGSVHSSRLEAAPTQSPRAPQAGTVCGAKHIGASTFRRWQAGPPGFPPQPRRKAGTHSLLSMLRLCRFAKQTSLPHPRSRGWKPLPQSASLQGLQLGEKDGRIRGRSNGSRIVRARTFPTLE